jgi:hypothetical protein
LVYVVTQHIRDEELLKGLRDYLGFCGKNSLLKDKEVWKLEVSSFEDIKNKIIPFFCNYPLLGINSLSFKDFCLAAKLIEEKRHLTEEGIKKLQILKARINNKAMIKRSNIV